jgi:hypothetical protein
LKDGEVVKRFRKKPIVVEAVQWNVGGALLGRECEDCDAVRGTSYLEINQMLGTSGCSNDETMWDWSRMGIIETLEGKHVVTPNDWIIKGVKGEFYPCKSDIFEATYEAVE